MKFRAKILHEINCDQKINDRFIDRAYMNKTYDELKRIIRSKPILKLLPALESLYNEATTQVQRHTINSVILSVKETIRNLKIS